MPSILGLASAALLLADGGDTARAAAIAALVGGYPVIRSNRGLRACLQPGNDAGPGFFGPEMGGETEGSDPSQAIWEMARQLGAMLSDSRRLPA